jgi:Zn finger protein HypA/HybF involved in hydrogenase expression
MTAIKLNRFSFDEIENVTIRCRKCGGAVVVKIDNDPFITDCPSCGQSFGRQAQKAMCFLRIAYGEMQAARESIDIEFDIIEK